NIERQISEFVRETFFFYKRKKEIDPDTSFLEEGIVDSTGILELVLFLETKLGVDVADEDVVPENFDSIRGLVAYVHRKLGIPLCA
ncbi:MAG: acyl carrier protein, partial [Chloroflexi bacterium]|nr:acyl carrier protein [Chloroflexota bacterium]